MAYYYNFLSLLPLVRLVNANLIEERQNFDLYYPCPSCFQSSWTQGPECKTDSYLLSTISRILNPPPEATSTYTPSQWCSDYLRQTDWNTFKRNISTISTHTSTEYYEPVITETDLSQPTFIAWCPLPSSGMECGWDTNSINPDAQAQDRSFSSDGIGSAEDCLQACLKRSDCKAYRWDERDGYPCSIFNVGIGSSATNLVDPTPGGNQWWDRNCQAHIPFGCGNKTATAIHSSIGYENTSVTALPYKTLATGTPSAQPTITTPPVISAQPAIIYQPNVTAQSTVLPQRIIPAFPLIAETATAHIPPNITRTGALAKHDVLFPPYFANLSYIWSSFYVTPACSCIISSVLPPVSNRTTTTMTRYNATTSITSTVTLDPFTMTVTARETTEFVSIE